MSAIQHQIRLPRVSFPPVSGTAKALMASPIFLLLATGTRLLVISNYDTTTASTIASENGAVGTLLGTVIPLLPAFLPVVGLVLLMNRGFIAAALAFAATAFVSPALGKIATARHETWVRWHWAIKNGQRAETVAYKRPEKILRTPYEAWIHRNQALPVAEHVWRYLMTDWRWQSAIYALVAFALAYRAGDRFLNRQGRANFLDFFVRKLTISAVMAFICFFSHELLTSNVRCAAQLDNDWNNYPQALDASRELTLKSGETRVGYLISTKDNWFVLLQEPSRTIQYIHADDVVARNVCTSFDVLPDTTHNLPLIKLHGVKPVAATTCSKIGGSSAVLTTRQ